MRSTTGAIQRTPPCAGIEAGVFTGEPFTQGDASSCRRLLRQYRDLDLGLADASVIVTAERLGLKRILTVNERDFRAVRTARGGAFVLLPADAGANGGASL